MDSILFRLEPNNDLKYVVGLHLRRAASSSCEFVISIIMVMKVSMNTKQFLTAVNDGQDTHPGGYWGATQKAQTGICASERTKGGSAVKLEALDYEYTAGNQGRGNHECYD